MNKQLILSVALIILIVVVICINRRLSSYEKDVKFKLPIKPEFGFDINEVPDEKYDTLDYKVMCSNVNEVVPLPTFDFNAGVTRMNCPSSNDPCVYHQYMCQDVPNYKRTSVINPTDNGLLCVYEPLIKKKKVVAKKPVAKKPIESDTKNK